ncbi:hypothetical protein [Alicyclobacillus sp. ALC3]|uniref:hypothetical protein n=1 Tax=Alicyclobacillus sp. ALC3 TaxID=2796143 RepID=UPI0023781029|nr:hypothetical protein [Alicyclobacillus sp. ALC3]WDL98115.1 hypothetical protein JC200_05285 [Alicyclobacillus sp. ALC3]
MTLVVVMVLATWACVGFNFVVWEGLYFFRHLLHIHEASIDYQLSVWPVMIDLVILMATVMWTYEQLELQRGQSTMLEAVKVQTDAVHRLHKQGVQRDAKLERLMQQVYGEVHEIGEDVESIVDEMTAPEADAIIRLETDAERHARNAAMKRGEDIGS